jgi:hypothetical protein
MTLLEAKQFDKLNQLSDLFKNLSFLATECTQEETNQINKTLMIIYSKAEALNMEMNKPEEVKEAKQEEKQYNYFKDGIAITKKAFLENVPENWQEDIDQYGEYSSGNLRAVERN